MTSSLRERAQALDPARVVLLGAIVLIAAQALFRGWAIYGGWFYGDDYKFLAEGYDAKNMSVGYLFSEHNSYFMPGGRALSWFVAHAGAFNWTLAATIILVMQILASCACFLMLRVLFGARPWILALLFWYLFSPITITAYMWWAAAINQLPFQAMFFIAITTHVLYLRTGRRLWALLTLAAILVGLVFYMKALLIVVPLGVITLFFGTSTQAGWKQRLREAVLGHWKVWTLLGVPLATYAVLYRMFVTSPFNGSDIPYGDIAQTMLHTSLGASLVGGPWRWANFSPPLPVVAPPDWTVTAGWIVVAVWVVLMVTRRGRPLIAFLVPISYLALTWWLLASGRGADLGGYAGLELRYLADAAPAIVVGLGLFAFPLVGLGDKRAEEVELSSSPVLSPSLARIAIPVTVCAVAISAIWSSATYAQFWTGGFPAKTYTQVAANEAKKAPLVLAREAVPPNVGVPFEPGFNDPEPVFATLGDRVSDADRGNDLKMLAPSGRPFPAYVSGGVESMPGPRENCGYAVKGRWVEIPMQGELTQFFWWMQISYLSGGDGSLEVTYDDKSEILPVERGTHSLYLKGNGPIAPITLTSLTDDVRLCVDRVAVGQISALEPFE